MHTTPTIHGTDTITIRGGKHTATVANPQNPFAFLSINEYLLKQWCYFSSEFTYELRIFTEMPVSYVQHFYFIRTTLEVFTYVLAVDWFHDDDEFSPIYKRLTQRCPSWFWHDARWLCLPVALPSLEEFFRGWTTLEVSGTYKENRAQMATRYNSHQTSEESNSDSRLFFRVPKVMLWMNLLRLSWWQLSWRSPRSWSQLIEW